MTDDEFKAWREKRQWSRVEAASALGRSKRQIEAYERGEAKIPLVVELAVKALREREEDAG